MTTTPMSSEEPAGYPIAVEVPEPQPQSRLSIFLRLIYAIPHLLIISALGNVVGVIALIAWVAILFTGNYPPGLYRFVAGYLRWATRVYAYMVFHTDQYPPFSLEEEPSYVVRVTMPQELENRNRVTVLFRWILAIPAAIVFAFVALAAFFVWIAAWLAGIASGSIPEGMHNFLTGSLRWGTRLNGYVYLLTDAYPPFSMK